MQQRTNGPNVSMPAVVAIAGGAVLSIGALLPWFKLAVKNPSANLPITASFSGTNFAGGIIALVCGIALIAAGVIMLMSPGMKRGMGIVAIVVGAVAALFVFIDIFNKTTILDSLIRKSLNPFVRSQTGHDITDAELALIKAQIGLSEQFGIFVAAIGSVVGLVGGIMAVGSRAAAPAAPSFAVSEGSGVGSGGAGWDTTPAPPAPMTPPAAPEPTTPPPAAEPAPEGEQPPANDGSTG
jgi:hypothetical protein